MSDGPMTMQEVDAPGTGGRGPDGTGASGLMVENGRLETGVSCPVVTGRRPCEGTTKRGAVCAKTIGTKTVDGRVLCPVHRPKAAVDAPRAPVRAIRTPADA